MSQRFENSYSLPIGIISCAMVMCVAFAIGTANLVRSVDMMVPLVAAGFLGFGSGTLLALSRFPTLTAHIYSLVYGSFVTTYLFGRTYDADVVWRTRVADMVGRQVEFVFDLINGSTNRDGPLFLVHTTAVMWLLAYTVAWFTFRRNKLWRVVIPGGLVLMSVVYNYFGSPIDALKMRGFLALYVVLALIFIALTHLISNENEWRFKFVRYDRSIIYNFVRSSLMIGLFALALAWFMPPLSASASVGDAVSRVTSPWRDFRDEWQRMYSALNAQSRGTSDPYRDKLNLGGPRNVTDQPIMDVYVDEELPYAYWRSTIHDHYEDGQWRVAEGESTTHFPDDGDINVPKSNGRRQIDQTFVNYIPNAGTIYAAPDLVSSERQIIIKSAPAENGASVVSASRSRYVMQLGDRYVVTSNFSVADETSLRSTDSEYPTYIANRYLEVPESITQRTVDLASQLTWTLDNPYDKTLTVQNFLREYITYNDQIDVPPPDAEPIDHVLFESREGYCTYYASAMAMMLRSQGIPTRLGRGFAAGEFNEDNGLYRVRAKDAHTWVEVYFNEYGWVPFEPTTIIATVDRTPADGLGAEQPGLDEDLRNELLGNDEYPEEESLDERLEGINQEDVFNPAGADVPTERNWQAIGAVLVVLMAVGAVVLADRMNRSVEGTVDGSYGRLSLWGRWLRLPMLTTQTPHERADMIVSAAPEGESPIRTITDSFVKSRFTRRKQADLFTSTNMQWRTLRPILLREGIRKRMPNWLKR